MPKPPPTSGVVTRTAALSSPMVRASSSRRPQTPWPEKATCSRAPSHSAKQPRGSIGIAFARLSTSSRRVVCAAAAKARVHRRLVAVRPVEGEVVRRLRMDRRPADGRRHVHRQVVEVEGDHLRRVEARLARLGHHDRERLAGEAHRRRRPAPAAAAWRRASRRGSSPPRRRWSSRACRRSPRAVKTATTPGAAAAVAHVESSAPARAPPGCAGRPRAARPPAPRRRCSVPVRSESARPPCGARSGWFRTSWLPRSQAASLRFSGAAPDTSGFHFGVQ